MRTAWESAGAADPDAGRRTIRELLEAGGLAVNTTEYNRAVEEFLRGQAAAIAARQAAADERERARVEPYLAEARDNVMTWGCVEDGSTPQEEIAELVTQEATRLADEAEERVADEALAAEREAAELADYCMRQEALAAAVQAATDAAISAGWRIEQRQCSHDCSRYFWVVRCDDDDDEHEQAVSLRISDHHAKSGSGWCESKQAHHDEPDINIVLRRASGGAYTFDMAPLMETIGR